MNDRERLQERGEQIKKEHPEAEEASALLNTLVQPLSNLGIGLYKDHGMEASANIVGDIISATIMAVTQYGKKEMMDMDAAIEYKNELIKVINDNMKTYDRLINKD